MLIWPRFLHKSHRDSRGPWVFLGYHGKLCSEELFWRKPVAFVVCVTVVLEGKCYWTDWFDSFFQKAAMLVSPSLLLLSKIYQVLKVGVEFERWDGYRQVQQRCTRALICPGSNTLTLRAGRLNPYKLRETKHVPSSINGLAFFRAEAPLFHGTHGYRADTSVPWLVKPNSSLGGREKMRL